MSIEETINHVTPLSAQRVSFFKTKQCHLVFTDQRIIVAYFDPRKVQEKYKKTIEEKEQNGKKANVFKKIGARFTSMSGFDQEYLVMPIDTIMQEHADNYAIDSKEITKLIYKRGKISQNQDGYETKNSDQLMLVTEKQGKQNFTLAHGQFEPVSNTLDVLIPEGTFKRDKVLYQR